MQQQQQNMATTSGTGPSPGTSTGSSPSPGASSGILVNMNPPQGATVATAVSHVPVLHIVGSLPSPVADVAQILHKTTLVYQRSQASAFFDFMDGTSPALLRLNEVNQVNVALVNVPKTHLVKVVHCVGVGTSPIGETPTQVDGKLLFLHGDDNQEFGPPQPLCLPESMV